MTWVPSPSITVICRGLTAAQHLILRLKWLGGLHPAVEPNGYTWVDTDKSRCSVILAREAQPS